MSSVKLIPSLRFTISQNTRDSLFLKTLINFFGCGYITEYKKRSVCVFTVTRIDQVIKYVIPFFEKHPVIESKQINYLNFKSAALMIYNKEHLNKDGKGLLQILQLKKGMNNATNSYRSKTGKEEI